MKLDKLAYTNTRSALNAAGEALELLCRLRQIPLDSLSDAQLGEFFFDALEDEPGVPRFGLARLVENIVHADLKFRP